MFLELQLPTPSTELISEVIAASNLQKINEMHVERIAKINDYKINIAACSYFSSAEILDLAITEYGPLFDEQFNGIGLSLTNPNPSIISHYPPHADRARSAAINFIIWTGGENVTTTAYDRYGSYETREGALHWYDPELVQTGQRRWEAGEWYALDAVQYHSVENIENVRLMFALSFRNITLNEIYKKYGHFVKSVI